MSRKLRFRVLIGLVTMIAVVIGVLVYPPPKIARADLQYTVHIFFDSPPVGLGGCEPRIWFANEFEEHLAGPWMEDIGGGWYEYTVDILDPEWTQWQVQLSGEDLESNTLVDPDTNPSPYLPLATDHLEWEVSPNVFK